MTAEERRGLALVAIAGLAAAIVLSIGIGIQNFPEGVAVAMSLRGEGMSRLRSFWYGQLSALVEPIAAVVGAMIPGTSLPREIASKRTRGSGKRAMNRASTPAPWGL